MYKINNTKFDNECLVVTTDLDGVTIKMYITNRHGNIDTFYRESSATKPNVGAVVLLDLLKNIEGMIDNVGLTACPDRVDFKSYMQKYNLTSIRNVKLHQQNNLNNYYMELGFNPVPDEPNSFIAPTKDVIKGLEKRIQTKKLNTQ